MLGYGCVHAHEVQSQAPPLQAQSRVPVSANPHTRGEQVPSTLQEEPLLIPEHWSSLSVPTFPELVAALVSPVVLAAAPPTAALVAPTVVLFVESTVLVAPPSPLVLVLVAAAVLAPPPTLLLMVLAALAAPPTLLVTPPTLLATPPMVATPPTTTLLTLLAPPDPELAPPAASTVVPPAASPRSPSAMGPSYGSPSIWVAQPPLDAAIHRASKPPAARVPFNRISLSNALIA